jgi:hypothetical protein
MTIIYLVKGLSGEYDDTYRWVAKAYTNKQKAEDLCKKLNDIAQRGHAGNFGKDWGSRDTDLMYQVQDEVVAELQRIDPKASFCGNGISYSIEELEVEIG